MKTVWISFPDAPYTQESACRAAKNVLGKAGWAIQEGEKGKEDAPKSCQLYFADYDYLPFEDLHPGVYQKDIGASTRLTTFPQLSCYSIRKSLIRKNYLANSLHLAKLKRSSSKQQEGVQKVPLSINGDDDSIAPKTWVFEATCADDLDELLTDELYDMREELEENRVRKTEEKKWYILKPAMADRGMGIRLLDSVESLQEIFEEFEDNDEESEEEEDDDDDDDQKESQVKNNTSIVTSQLRHFVIQEYLAQPLLIQPKGLVGGHKFHLRAYVLAQGSLRVFLYNDMLALFAPKPYQRPDGTVDLSSHLTNTCLQEEEAATVHLLSDLVGCPYVNPDGEEKGKVMSDMISRIQSQACSVIAETFQACANADRVHFQPWPYAWEIFGVDLMVEYQNEATKVWLLEVNAQPDFARTGEVLQGKIDRLFERTLEITALEGQSDQERWELGKNENGMTLCLELPLSAGGW